MKFKLSSLKEVFIFYKIIYICVCVCDTITITTYNTNYQKETVLETNFTTSTLA